MGDPLTSALLILLGSMLVWLVACVALSSYAWRGQIDADERHPVRTDDGWTIWLHRFQPRGEARWDTPVVLGHGLMMNRWCWSLSGSGSLPRALAERGHDVYVAEYRGAGMSRPPAGQARTWTLDDHLHHDLPALIEDVCARTGTDGVNWVGHSMGGILGYLRASQPGTNGGIRRLITLGSPVDFDHVPGILGPLSHPARSALRRMGSVQVRPLMFLCLPFVALIPRVALRVSGASAHLNLRERLALTRLAFEDGSADLCAWFLDRSMRKEQVCPQDAATETGGGFSDLDIPTLVVAGQADVLAPPGAVRRAFDETEGIPAAYKLFGDPSGPTADSGPALGHADLISGEVAMQHVLPLIAEWLESQEPKAERATMRNPNALD